MKAVKIIGILLIIYVGIVVAFESLLGYYQPEGQNTLVITTTDDEGNEHSRVVSRLETDGNLYVAANHWPRTWYYQALENPNVAVDLGEGAEPYVAVPVEDQEHDRVNEEHGLGIVFKVLTGFPPRYFVRLDPR